MTLPAVILGIIISTLYGAIFHLWRGGNLGRLLLYILLSWLGFWTGQILGNQFNFTFDSLGSLHLGAASIGSLLFLLVGYWLSLVQVERH